MNSNSFNELWTAHPLDQTERLDFWNKRAPSFDLHSTDAQSCENRKSLVDGLMAKAELTARSRVLDVGCGPGRHSILFARQVGWVEAFDFSPVMIERAEQNAREAGQRKVSFQVLDWASADLRRLDWKKRFDLVLASKTPAVNELAALEKMNAASRGFCCFITQADTRNSVREELRILLEWDREKARISNSFYCAFNLLWLMGYYPEISYYDRTWESEVPLEESLSTHVYSFERVAPLKPKQKKALADKLEALSRGGLIREQVESKVAVLFWSVNIKW